MATGGRYQILVLAALFAVILCGTAVDANDNVAVKFRKENVKEIGIHHYIASIKALEKSVPDGFECPDRSEKPRLDLAWYGFDDVKKKLANFKSCSDLARNDTGNWRDYTEKIRSLCEEKGPCPIPGTDDDYFHKSDQREMFWLLCFSCRQNKNRVPRNDKTDGYEHHPVGLYEASRNMAGKDRRTREKFAFSHLEQRLANFTRFNFVIQGRMKSSESLRYNAEELMNMTEESIKDLTPIVGQKEVLTFNVTNVGRIQMGKGLQEFNKKVHLLANDHTVVSVVEFQPDITEALMPTGSNLSLSRIVAVTMFDDDDTRAMLLKPVTIEFEHGSQIRRTPSQASARTTLPPSAYTVQCVYWDFTTSNWSTNGCVPSTSYHDGIGNTVCKCDHLTNFALILDIAADFDLGEWEALRTVTFVCCGLSAGCLLASVLFFVSHRAAEMTDRIRINAHFCANLLVVHLLMIFGIGQTSNGALCFVVGAALQLFILCAFAWSLQAAHQIYVLLVQIFDSGKKRFSRYLVCGYAGPLAIVAASILTDYATGSGTYGLTADSDSCWMASNSIYTGFFLFPVASILLVNMATLALVIIKVLGIRPRPPLLGQARGWLALLILLGGTWLVGAAAKAVPAAKGLVVTFVVLNSLQGVLLFVVHVCFGQRCQRVVAEEVSSVLKSVPGVVPIRASGTSSHSGEGGGGGGGGSGTKQEKREKRGSSVVASEELT